MALDSTDPLLESGQPRERTMLVSNAPAYLCGRPVGEILVHLGHTTPEKIEEALQIQKEKGGRLGAVLVGLKAVTEEQVLEALGAQLDLPLLREIRGEQLDLELVRKVPINFAKQARLLPLRLEGELAAVAINDPLDTAALDYARALLGAPVEPRLATDRKSVV